MTMKQKSVPVNVTKVFFLFIPQGQPCALEWPPTSPFGVTVCAHPTPSGPTALQPFCDLAPRPLLQPPVTAWGITFDPPFPPPLMPPSTHPPPPPHTSW